MIIINNKYLHCKVVILRSFFAQFCGLMFKRKTKKIHIFLLKKKNLIPHMWFVFFKIDVIFLNENKKVVGYSIGKPFRRIYAPTEDYEYIIETERGFVKKHKIQLASKINWEI
jgi:uncharacterized membrane protein (UPF0127 family)